MESSQVVRARAAVAELNTAEAMLVRDLPGASPLRAGELAHRVGLARVEFDAALSELQEVVEFDTSHHVDEDPERSMQEGAVCW